MIRIVFTRVDGGVTVTDPAIADLDRVIARCVYPGATNVRVIDDSELPVRNEFRNAWTNIGTALSIDMPRARVIKTNLIRRERNERLAAEDVELKKAEDEANPGEVNRIRAKRRSLRDVPADVQPDLDAITTPGALEAFEPAWPT